MRRRPHAKQLAIFPILGVAFLAGGVLTSLGLPTLGVLAAIGIPATAVARSVSRSVSEGIRAVRDPGDDGVEAIVPETLERLEAELRGIAVDRWSERAIGDVTTIGWIPRRERDRAVVEVRWIATRDAPDRERPGAVISERSPGDVETDAPAAKLLERLAASTDFPWRALVEDEAIAEGAGASPVDQYEAKRWLEWVAEALIATSGSGPKEEAMIRSLAARGASIEFYPARRLFRTIERRIGGTTGRTTDTATGTATGTAIKGDEP